MIPYCKCCVEETGSTLTTLKQRAVSEWRLTQKKDAKKQLTRCPLSGGRSPQALSTTAAENRALSSNICVRRLHACNSFLPGCLTLQTKSKPNTPVFFFFFRLSHVWYSCMYTCSCICVNAYVYGWVCMWKPVAANHSQLIFHLIY